MSARLSSSEPGQTANRNAARLLAAALLALAFLAPALGAATRAQAASVMTWGDDGEGQLGLPVSADDPKCGCVTRPTTVAGLSGVTQVALGHELGLALRADGTVAAWGENGSGELGREEPASSRTPLQVPFRSVTTNADAYCLVLDPASAL